MDTEGNNSRNNSTNRTVNQTYRVYSEGIACNNKIYSESETSARVLNNSKHLRNGTKFYYERVPEERIEEFGLTRKVDEDRGQRRINNRFPELSAAREAYLGKEPNVA